jgi:alpha-1,6-mannosyltransferase
MGSCLVAIGGFGVGAVPARRGETWLHDSDPGRVLSTVLCVVGVVGLLWAWWRLRGCAPGIVLQAAGAWSLALLVTAPLFSRDVYAYAGQAHLVSVGLDPYAHGPADAPGPLAAEVDDVWAHARSPYGPVFLRVSSWLLPGEHVMATVLVQRALALVGLALLAWALLRLADDASTALWLAVANPLVLLHGVGGPHNDLLMAGLLAAGLAIGVSAGGSGRRVELGIAIGAAVITVAALVKAPAAAGLVFLPFVAATARLRAALVVAVTSVTVAVVVTAASGLGWGWVHTLGAGNARRSLLSVSTGVGVLAENVVGSGALDVAHAAGLGVAALLGVLLLVRASRLGALRALGLSLLAVVVLGPVVQPWYLIWVLAVLAAVAGPRLTVALGAASAVACLLILPGGRHVIRPPLYGVPAVVVMAAGYAAARAVDLGGANRP